MSERTIQESLESLVDRFIDFEKRTNACGLRVGGVAVWDCLRMPIFSRLAVWKGIYATSHSYEKKGIRARLMALTRHIKTASIAWRMLNKGGLELVIANPRRKRDPFSGKYVDPYTDPLIDSRPGKALVIEFSHEGGHLVPAWTEKIGYLDLVSDAVTMAWRALTIFFYPAVLAERNRLTALSEAFFGEFGMRVDFRSESLRVLARRAVALPIYRSMIRRSGCERLFLVCSYGKENLIEACARERVRSIELQHGTLSEYHLGYHYPEGTGKRYVPDEFWAFGPYWTKKAAFAAGMKLVPDSGFAYLDRYVDRYRSIKKNPRIVVVSQGSVGGRLSKTFCDQLDSIPPEIRVSYKLHPGETFGWTEAYPWLKEAAASGRVDVVEGQSPDLYEIFAESEWLVGVYSTAIYEGFRFGCRTILFDLPGIEYMRDVAAAGDAVIFDGKRGTLGELIRSGIPAPDGMKYFTRAAADRAIPVPGVSD